jgi:hypothetical protein
MYLLETERYATIPFVPAHGHSCATFRRAKAVVPIAMQEFPQRICGRARRVGRIYRNGQELALYRLKPTVMIDKRPIVITLPGFFFIEQGRFIPYE